MVPPWTVLPEGIDPFAVFLLRGLHTSLLRYSRTQPRLYLGKSKEGIRPATTAFWTRYYLSNKDMSNLNSILFPFQRVLECSVLNLHIFIAKKHWIKPISYKTDNTDRKFVNNVVIIFTKDICNLVVHVSQVLNVVLSIPFCQVERERW